MSLIASQQARFVRQFVHQWLATQPLQAPHLNICRGAIATTVGASLADSLCAGLVLWQSFRMKTDNLEKQVKLLSILVDGCKKHPAYRAIRPATGRCKPCVDMWQARQELEELNK